ncbi:C39 family peptidase [Aquimarina sp. 2201CG14-23]|uniref:C39 family peptidase n=1 Tax=Aquimarina mycalae TaxID=3040073 RepID=UPI002477D37E|nr:papain-like cysteine protease family protein [Aquimarina sp. 2201CG14-23]MDH7446624.1 papain-like cysteine protease family protein [Aquimarina sp. 2201CG14-23]
MDELTSTKGNVRSKLDILIERQIGINNCWAAALSMALQNYGLHLTGKTLDEMFEANNQGLDLFTLHPQISSHFAYVRTEYRSEIMGHDPKLTFAEIQGYIDNSQPVLIGTQNYGGHRAHALLIIGYEGDDIVLIADPWTGSLVEMKHSELINYWVESLVFDR